MCPQGGLASAAAPFGARYERLFYIRKNYSEGRLGYVSVWEEGQVMRGFFTPRTTSMQIQSYLCVLVNRRSSALNCFLKI